MLKGQARPKLWQNVPSRKTRFCGRCGNFLHLCTSRRRKFISFASDCECWWTNIPLVCLWPGMEFSEIFHQSMGEFWEKLSCQGEQFISLCALKTYFYDDVRLYLRRVFHPIRGGFSLSNFISRILFSAKKSWVEKRTKKQPTSRLTTGENLFTFEWRRHHTVQFIF